MAADGLRPGMAGMVLSALLAALGCYLVRDPNHTWMVPAGFYINIACMWVIWTGWMADALRYRRECAGRENDSDEDEDDEDDE